MNLTIKTALYLSLLMLTINIYNFNSARAIYNYVQATATKTALPSNWSKNYNSYSTKQNTKNIIETLLIFLKNKYSPAIKSIEIRENKVMR